MEKIILLMDNNQEFLEVQSRLLEEMGFRVLRAPTLDDAERKLREKRIHLAILDIRMLDEDDEHDISGLLLAQKEDYRPVPKIVLTAYPSYEYVREALGLSVDGLPPAVNFLDKDEGPEALIRAVQKAFVQHVRIDWSLHIHWAEKERLSFPHLAALIEPDLHDIRLPDRAGELEDLFRQLFHEESQITIGRSLWHREERVCVTVFTFSSDGGSEQCAVTCGLRPRIEQENAFYREFRPKGTGGTALIGSAGTMHFAATAYALPEADLQQVHTFAPSYRTSKASQVRTVLEHLFQSTLAPWHQKGRIVEEAKSLSQFYRQRLNLTHEIPQKELQQRVQALGVEALSLGPTQIALSAQELTLRFPNGDTISFPNPIAHIYKETAGSYLPVVCHITPGTLTGDNILVDQNGQTWLTDFAQSGPAPLLWDFVAVEAMIRFDLVESTDLQALHEFERRLVTPARLNERLDAQDIDPEFRKALSAIQQVRHLAFSSAGIDPTPYYEGLLFRAMSGVSSYVPDIRHTPQELARPVHALLAAAMICSKTMQTMEGSLSGCSSPPSRGMEVDEANRQVKVEGRHVALSSSEFDLLLYLYNHPRQLCSRRSIVEDGLKSTYMGDKQEASRINTLIGRLRKKTEPDPDNPQYIVTVRGEGYMLRPEGKRLS